MLSHPIPREENASRVTTPKGLAEAFTGGTEPRNAEGSGGRMDKFGVMGLGVFFYQMLGHRGAGWRDGGARSEQEKPSPGTGRALEHVSAGTRGQRS